MNLRVNRRSDTPALALFSQQARSRKDRFVCGIVSPGGGNTENRDKIAAVQRMQDFIERHLTDVITMHKLAHAAGYSPWHCARIFRELTGRPPF